MTISFPRSSSRPRPRPRRGSGTRSLVVRLVCATVVFSGLSLGDARASVASAEAVTGRWSGTISMSSEASFDYRIGYRGSGTTTSQATSQHSLSWTLRFDDVQGGSDLGSAGGSATVLAYDWAGSATSSVSGCGYSASGGMQVTDAGGYSFDGLVDGGAEVSSLGAQPEALMVSRPAGDCYSNVTFGFSGPNAGTLGEDQWWDAYLLNPSPPEPNGYPRFSLCWHTETLSALPIEDRPDGTRRMLGTSTGSCDGTKVEWFGDSDVSHVMDVAVSYTYDLTFVPGSDASGCAGPTRMSYDAFRATVPGSEEPRLHFDLTTEWCTSQDGSVLVKSIRPFGTTLQSPFAFALDAAVAEFFAYRDVWRSPSTDWSSGGSVVTGSGKWEHCLGLPLLGKISWVKRFPRALRYASALLRRVDGKFEDAARQVARLMDKAADAVAWAIDKGTRAAKWVAKEAVELLGKAIYALGERAQVKILLITVGVIADYSSSAAWARDYIKALPRTLIEESDPLGKFLSAEVCFRGWKPRIKQTLGTPGVEGTFVDRTGDYEDWTVTRHTGAF